MPRDRGGIWGSHPSPAPAILNKPVGLRSGLDYEKGSQIRPDASLRPTEPRQSFQQRNREHIVPLRSSTNPMPGPSRETVPAMFDRIAHRYDLLNHMLSLGRDIAWRRRMVRLLPAMSPGSRVLDLATGTGDVLLGIAAAAPALVVGVDPARAMLERARAKAQSRGPEQGVSLIQADALRLPLASEVFDAVTVAFGLRNMPDVPAVLAEILRILRPGGRLIVLEFSLPARGAIRAPYLFYFRHILPWVGGLLSGQPAAYRYLNQTVEAFPYGADFCALLGRAGFADAAAQPLTCGIASLYTAEKEVAGHSSSGPAAGEMP